MKPTLIPCNDNENPFIFFPDIPDKVTGKIYCNGSHYVLTPYMRACDKRDYARKSQNDDLRGVFNCLYSQAVELFNGYDKKTTQTKRRAFLMDNLCPYFEKSQELENYVDEHIKAKLNNLHSRKKRFRRKAFLNRWTHFVTITYSDDKHDETTFRNKLRRCLMNLHTRRGWRYMGVFERGEETNRLHFHALLYVPDGGMVGKIRENRDYSVRLRKMKITYVNDFFERRFGKNDFSEIDRETLCRDSRGIEYILKYLEKSGEKIVYSRGVPSSLYAEVDKSDIVLRFQDFVIKYILSDDVINWRDDFAYVRRKIPPEQITIEELCSKMIC